MKAARFLWLSIYQFRLWKKCPVVNTEYETERNFAMFLIAGYTFARRKECKQHGTIPPPNILQGLVAEELKDMKTLAKGKSTVIFTPPVTENPSK
jgi:hypothetical protein